MTVVSQHALMQARLDSAVDSAVARMGADWAAAWSKVAAEYEAAVLDLLSVGDGGWPSRKQIRRAERAQQALETTATQITILAGLAATHVTQALPALLDGAQEFEQAMIRAQLPAGAGVSRVDTDAIKSMVERVTQQVTSLLHPLSAEATVAMRSALIRGVTVGDNPRAVARDMLTRCEGVFNGGLNRAGNIARTEMLDAHRTAASATRRANEDVVKGWTWVCELSARSCSACLSMHGTEHLNGEDGPEGHQRCRCTAAPLTKTWEELGFDSINEPETDFRDAEAWFNNQPKATQTQIMGTKRLDAYKSGDLPWDRLAVRQTNPGWRASYVPRKVN